MEQNRPRGREKHVTNQSGSVYRRGNGLGGGPVGSGGRGDSSGPSNRNHRGGGRRSPLSLIIILILALLGGGGGLGSLLSGSSSSGPSDSLTEWTQVGSGNSGNGGHYGTWSYKNNSGVLNTKTVSGARKKRTVIKGGQSDQITFMVYMCGADLESRSAMATKDLMEMAAAATSDNVNIIVYTGGAKTWQNDVISSSVNQIYQVKDNALVTLVSNAGNQSMTNPATLTEFIQYCSKNYPANRNELIFWDHGGGSVTGYGYDETHPSSGSMSLAGINTALKNAGVTFDLIGFDACLMATVETSLMLDQYADYLVASEETEPGIGWYYTNFLTKLSERPDMNTVDLGKIIADDFVSECNKNCRGQKTTLSVIDLAEAAAAIPSALSDFSKETTKLIQNNSYQTVSNARYQTREFAQSSKIDQIDLVHLAKNMGNATGDRLADAILDVVKYNQTSSNMTNAYGLSVYFPARKVSGVDSAVRTYQQIGMDEEYSRCIQAFASMGVSGQAAAGGTSSVLPSLLESIGSLSTGSGSQSSYGNADLLTQLLGELASGSFGDLAINGLSAENIDFLSNKALDPGAAAAYIEAHHLDAADLHWNDDGVMALTEEDWSLIQELRLNVYVDDGSGFIDLGLDNVFDFDEDGNLLGSYDGTWLAIEGRPVAYYHESTVEDGDQYTITGYVPAYLNQERVNLMLVFDETMPQGKIVGAVPVYENQETEALAKNLLPLEEGDTLDFVCDYYSYDGTYQDSYYLGEPLTVTSDMEISNISINEPTSAVYQITDLYHQIYWTPVIPN